MLSLLPLRCVVQRHENSNVAANQDEIVPTKHGSINAENDMFVEEAKRVALRIDSPSQDRLDDIVDQWVEAIACDCDSVTTALDVANAEIVDVRKEQRHEDRGRSPEETHGPEVCGEDLEEIWDPDSIAWC